MQFGSLKELILNIQKQIEDRNIRLDDKAIPFSDEFIPRLVHRLGIAPDKVGELLNLMANSNMIFIIEVVKADRAKKASPIDGYVIPRGDTVAKLRENYESELAKQYAVEFNVSISPSRVVREIEGRLDDLNNTHLGRLARIAYKLGHLQRTLEWNISRYNPREQEKELDVQLSMNPDLAYFMTPSNSNNEEKKDSQRRVLDNSQYDDFVSYSRRNSLERTLAVYGAEFYSRVCFRDYQFNLIKKVVDDGLIKKKEELQIIKKLLQKERSNADRDLKIQEYANDINNLEKAINEQLKKLS